MVLKSNMRGTQYQYEIVNILVIVNTYFIFEVDNFVYKERKNGNVYKIYAFVKSST